MTRHPAWSTRFTLAALAWLSQVSAQEISELRLAGQGIDQGPQGRLEVLNNGEWGTVCDDGFDDRAATVICKQLGWPGGRATWDATPFGAGTGRIWLTARCTGSESSLSECTLSWSPSNCDHAEDAGVICYDQRPLRLVNGSDVHQGRLEVQGYDGVWGTVCDPFWREENTALVCRQLGYAEHLDKAVAIAGGVFGTGEGVALMNGISCTGFESYMTACRFDGWGMSVCDAPASVMSVDCLGTIAVPPPPALAPPDPVDLWPPGEDPPAAPEPTEEAWPPPSPAAPAPPDAPPAPAEDVLPPNTTSHVLAGTMGWPAGGEYVLRLLCPDQHYVTALLIADPHDASTLQLECSSDPTCGLHAPAPPPPRTVTHLTVHYRPPCSRRSLRQLLRGASAAAAAATDGSHAAARSSARLLFAEGGSSGGGGSTVVVTAAAEVVGADGAPMDPKPQVLIGASSGPAARRSRALGASEPVRSACPDTGGMDALLGQVGRRADPPSQLAFACADGDGTTQPPLGVRDYGVERARNVPCPPGTRVGGVAGRAGVWPGGGGDPGVLSLESVSLYCHPCANA